MKILFRLVIIALMLSLMANCKDPSLEPSGRIEELTADVTLALKAENFNKIVSEKSADIPNPEAESSTGMYMDISDPLFHCQIEEFSAAPVHNDFMLYSPISDFYPSLLIRGGTHSDGSYAPLIYDRKPIKISINLGHNSGKITEVMQDVSLSGHRETLQKLLQEHAESFPIGQAKISIIRINSEEQFAGSFGFNYNSESLDLSSKFDWENKEVRSRFVVLFEQTFFDENIDIPARPSDWFKAPLPDPESWGPLSPTYVSSISYGRRAMIFAESHEEVSKYEAALNFVYKNDSDQIDSNLKLEYERIVNESKIEGILMGGSATQGIRAISNPDDFLNFVNSGANFSAESPGLPLRYQLRYLSDNSIASVLFRHKYTIRSCERIFYRYKITLTDIDILETDDSQDHIYGVVLAWKSPFEEREDAENSNTELRLWDKGESQRVDKGSGDKIEVNHSDILQFDLPAPGQSLNLEQEFITFYARFRDKPSIGSTKTIGPVQFKLYLKDVIGTQSIELIAESGNRKYRANFNIEPKL